MQEKIENNQIYSKKVVGFRKLNNVQGQRALPYLKTLLTATNRLVTSTIVYEILKLTVQKVKET